MVAAAAKEEQHGVGNHEDKGAEKGTVAVAANSQVRESYRMRGCRMQHAFW